MSPGALGAWRAIDLFAANRYCPSTYFSWLTYRGYHTLVQTCKQTRATPSGMHSTTCASDSVPLPCYFTYTPPVYDHFSVESPSASPIHSPGGPDCNPHHHPLLAYRPPQATTNRVSNNDFFRMQTVAAHESPIRPAPVPQQNLLQVTSDDSTTSLSSSSSSSGSSSASSSRTSLEMFSTPELARCSRCQRTPSTDVRTGKSNMVQYGLNLWYCSRCANLVGLVQR